MDQDTYLLASERTEKKFPEGLTLKADHIAILRFIFSDLFEINEAVDHMKRHIVYGAKLELQPPKSEFGSGKFLDQRQAELLHAALGKVTESIEFLEMISKHILGNEPLDEANAIEELGDGMWYDAIVLRNLSSNFDRAATINIDKLVARFPDKFDSHKALNRDLDTERGILEIGVSKGNFGVKKGEILTFAAIGDGVGKSVFDDSNDSAAVIDTLAD